MDTREKLEIIKKVSDLTHEKLAEELKVSFVTFNNWINGKVKPRKGALKRINNLYFSYTGVRSPVEDPLKAKKELIISKSKKYRNVLKEITNNPDIYDQFVLSLTYHTNKIEGSTLTENETKSILFDNVAVNKSLVEQLEAKNHQVALSYLFKEVKSKSFRIDRKFILKIHGILMNGIIDDAGSFRKHAVRILGSNVPTANYLKIPDLIEDLVNKFKIKDVIGSIAKFHSDFEKIHPFSDGNGRVGRLIMMAMLLENNLPPAVIKQQKKYIYNSSLKKSQLKNDFLSLEGFICDSVINGFLILERRG